MVTAAVLVVPTAVAGGVVINHASQEPSCSGMRSTLDTLEASAQRSDYNGDPIDSGGSTAADVKLAYYLNDNWLRLESCGILNSSGPLDTIAPPPVGG
jgi:hypothetical protein